jgi:hypothetical protein
MTWTMQVWSHEEQERIVYETDGSGVGMWVYDYKDLYQPLSLPPGLRNVAGNP